MRMTDDTTVEADDELRAAYNSVLGGVMAIAPDTYRFALDEIAEIAGRQNDESFRVDVRRIQNEVSGHLD